MAKKRSSKSRKQLPPHELFAANQVSADTERAYAYQLRNFQAFIESRGVDQIEAIAAQDILAYRQSLEDLAPATQKRYMATVRSFFAWALESGIVESDPSKQIKLPRAIQGRAPTFLTIEETQQLLETPHSNGHYGRRDLAMMWCFAHGLRVGEVAALNVGDLVIPTNGKGMPALRVRGKGSKARTVPIAAAAQDAIHAYLAERADVEDGHPLIACTYAGEADRRMSRRGLQERFRILAERAGLSADKRHPHITRHGFAVRMLFQSNAPGGIYTVSRLLGHSRVSTTEMYLHCSHERLEEAMLCDPLARAG